MSDELKNNGELTPEAGSEESRITNIDIVTELKKAFIDYSMSVIVSRALPDVRDGFKPVHRRILYTMHEEGITADSPTKKCASTVGNVLAKYHPHGDASVYDALVRLAQDFTMRYTLVEGQGNFGSIDGDPPAAYRYTEARMSKMSMEMLTDIEKDTVDFTPSFDNERKEPTVLPSRFPNLLVNGTMGIAVGMASNMAPHNLVETVEACKCVLHNPDATLEEIMEHLKGPDFPTGGIIMGRSGIRAAYATGRGIIPVRARTEIIEKREGRYAIQVTELPYKVNKAKLIESIADMVRDKRIEGISDIADHSSDRDGGMCITIDIKRDAQPNVVLNNLFKNTALQSNFSVNQVAIVNGEPKTLSLKQIIDEYLKFQLEVIVRRTNYLLGKAKDREHILDALIIAIDFIDEVISILRSSKTIGEGKERLMARFGFDDVQAQAIVNMRLGQLTGLEKSKLEEELASLREKIADYLDIIASEERQKQIISDDLTEIAKKFGDARRTEITTIDGEMDTEDLIAEENCVITMTNFGYLKRQKIDTYQTQHRGGRGIAGMATREEDVPTEMFIGCTHDYVMFFTNLGRVYRLKGYEIPEGSRTAKGTNVVNVLPLIPDEKVVSMLLLPRNYNGEDNVVMVTKSGIIKRTSLSAFDNVRKKGLIALSMHEGDELVSTKITDGTQHLLVATHKGYAIRFDENDVRVMSRVAAGVRSIKLRDGDYVVAMESLREGAKVLTISENGFGRLSEIDNYRLQSRGGMGIKNYRSEIGNVACIRVVDEDDDVIIINDAGVIIRIAVDEIRVCARPAKGVRVMKMPEEQRIVSVARVPHDEEAERAEIEDDGEPDDIAEEEAEETEEVGETE